MRRGACCFFIVGLFFASLVFAADIASDKKYPFGLLGSDHGILNETDLGVDAWRGLPKPYDPKGFNGGYPYWQCFPLKRTYIQYDHWNGVDPMGKSDKLVELCSIQFKVKMDHENHLYTGRRTLKTQNCRQHLLNWKKITKNQEFVCFNGYDGSIDEVREKMKVTKTWTWDRIKTKNGCDSYFNGQCDISYWRSQGYPN